MLISCIVQLQDEFSVSCNGSFRHVLLRILIIREACKEFLICRCYRIGLSGPLFTLFFYILSIQAFQIVFYCILRISVGCERSCYLYIAGRHLKSFFPAPAAEFIALFHRIRLNAYLRAVFIALCFSICRSVHLVDHIVAVPCVVQLQCQASISSYRSRCQRILSSFCIIRKAFIFLRSFRHQHSRRSSLISAVFQRKRSVQVLFIMLYPVLRILVGYDASFDLHILSRHLEVFLLAPAAEVITRRYFRRRSYCHVASIFIPLCLSVWLPIQLICHVVAVDREAAADHYVLGSHNFRQSTVPSIERVAFFHRLLSERRSILPIFISVYLSILLAVYHVSYRVLISCIVQLQDEFSVSCNGS